MYVTAHIASGLGNRLFQVAAMLGYAERHGHHPVFIRECIDPKEHASPHCITEYFPHIPVYSRFENIPGSWYTYQMSGEHCFTYIPLERVDQHVRLEGGFQTERYFPTDLTIPACLTTKQIPTFPYDRTAFLHVRRGDYLSPYTRHHRVELSAYFKRALSALEPDTHILVCSDDILWCIEHFPQLYPEIDRARWLWMPADASDMETMAMMVRCQKGAICANSTFSWWGAYFAHKNGCVYVCMPDTWGYAPLPPARDIYPSFAHKIRV